MVDIYRDYKDFKAFEVTFQRDEGQKHLFCNVVSIENDSFIIDAENEKNKNVFASVGDNIKLYIYTESGIYSAESRVLKVEKGLLSSKYTIEYPANTKHSQRREYYRADMAVETKIHVTPCDDSALGVTFEAKTRNICGKGMSVVLNEEIPPNSEILVQLIFSEKKISTNASLVYSKQIVEGNHPKFIHAFHFPDLSQKDVDFIVKKCFLYQLELRRQEKERLV